LLRVADEVVEYTCEIARASADVEYARACATGGTVAQIREEELGCVRVLFCESLERMFFLRGEIYCKLRAMCGADMVAS
jgi:hypothetical protein